MTHEEFLNKWLEQISDLDTKVEFAHDFYAAILAEQQACFGASLAAIQEGVKRPEEIK